jgi:hypothetical protein
MNITDTDFDMLFSTSTDLRSGPSNIPGRGRLNDTRWPETDTEGKLFDAERFRYLYAMPDAASTVLALAFLRGEGAAFQTIDDELGAPPGYVIFTDYASPCWQPETND